jgi:hypothetical protein
MSRANKYKRWNPFQAPLPMGTSAGEVHPKERAQVEQLIANGKFGHAVDIAKQVHKQLRNAASEALLVDAYVARICSLADRNLDAEAKALLDQVQAGHPSSRDRLREVVATLAARGRGVEGLMEMLADASLPAEKRAAIEARMRADADDPGRIARCEALPPEHPLRVAAGAVVRALEAVTSGPVAAESLALPEISRVSPLGPWKMAIRAIAAFYSHEDELCERYLAAVEPKSAPARLVPALRAMIGQKQTLTPAADVLLRQAGGGLAALRATLTDLDQALDKKNHPAALREMGKAAALCKEVCPDLLERLKQHISIRSLLAGTDAGRVTAAVGGPSLKNAWFWRLLARAYEETPGDPVAVALACSVWEEFRRHAVHEKWLPATGPEIATLYLHMVDLWRRLPLEELDHVVRRFGATFHGHREYYAGQPPEIRALMPPPGRPDFYFLNPDALFRRACEADPCPESFQRWLHWARQYMPHAENLVAERWIAALPQDIPPVLHLMQFAEENNALKRAFKLMEQAERIDGLNPEVRKARLRLLISLAKRHLQQNKVHLAEPELRQIEALPQAQQGDRPALVAALRWVYYRLSHAVEDAEASRATVARVLGSEPAAQILLKAVARACKLKGELPELKAKGVPLVAAFGRVCALGEDTGLPIEIPRAVSNQLMKELSGRDAMADPAGLRALGEAAMGGSELLLAYEVSAAGLRLAQERWAEFLFLRARALPDWEEERQALCAAAASELARRQRNSDLLRRIGEWREEEMLPLDGEMTDVAMTSKQIDDLIQREREESGYPDMPADDGFCDCPKCRAARGELPPVLERMMEDLGPEEVMRALEEIIGGGIGGGGIGGGPSKRRKGRRRPVFGDDDVPF